MAGCCAPTAPTPPPPPRTPQSPRQQAAPAWAAARRATGECPQLLRLALLRVGDADWARGVVEDRLADRTEQHAADAAAAAVAHEDQLGSGRGVQQRGTRLAERDLPQDGQL